MSQRKTKASEYLDRRRRNRVWRKILLFLGCMVVFATTYALILPAITQEQDSSIPDLLTGDNAYISLADMSVVVDKDTETGEITGEREAISTGTAPWDDDNNAGNDTDEKNNIVRTFDLVTYTVHYETKLQKETEQEGISGYKEGRVYFEFVLPLTEKEGQFATDEGVMSWLTTAKEVDYEVTTMKVDTGEKDEEGNAVLQEVQVLHGSFLETPTANMPSSIGASQRELTVAVRVLAMKNKETVAPQFTFWLKDNEVGTEYKSGKNGVEDSIPETLVTGSGYVCKTHDVKEYQTVTPTEIIVSAEPRYNVQIKENEDYANQYLGTWDFSTGNSGDNEPLVKGDFEREGRLVGFGATLQLYGKSASHGMRGVELPEGDITFQVKLSSIYKKLQGDGEDVDVTNTYTPLVWSADANEEWSNGANPDGRDTQGNCCFAYDSAPFNALNVEGTSAWKSKEVCCYNGGTWKFELDEEDPTILNVTVSGYEIDMTQLPNRDALNYDWDAAIYYDRETIGDQYWKIQIGCFSSGEFWILQPYQRDDNGTLRSVEDEYGMGAFSLEISDVNMEAASQTEQPAGKQMNDQDDRIVFPVELRRKGTLANYICNCSGPR